MCHLKALNRDILEDIIARFDGSTLASAACVCSDLRDAARDQGLWRNLCHSTWPSTALEEAHHLISSSPIGGFHNFYANSYPLISHAKPTSPEPFKFPQPNSHVSASDFASLVDVYYREECVFSKVLDGIPEALDIYVDEDNWNVISNEHQRWFSNCPFILDLFSLEYEYDDDNNELGHVNSQSAAHGHSHNTNNEERRALPTVSLAEDGKLREDHCEELVENVRLSWVLLDKKKGRTVNLSSWKPLLVQRSWPFNGDYVMQFGSIVPVEERLLPHKLAKCIITVRCNLAQSLKWREISMCIKDMTGACVTGSKGLLLLNHALDCLRSTNHLEVEQGFLHYEKQSREIMRQKLFKETLVDGLCVSVEVALFVIFCYFLI